jgi:replication initiator protein
MKIRPYLDWRTGMPLRPGKRGEAVFIGYGRQVDVAKLAAAMVTSSIRAHFDAIEHKLFAYLVHRAGRRIGDPVQHTVPQRDVLDFLDCKRAKLRDSLTRMANARIGFLGYDECGHRRDFRCNWINFDLDDASMTLTYSFALPVVEHMKNPRVFALIHLKQLVRFESGAAARLFQLMTILMGKKLQNSNYIRLDRNQMHQVFADFTGVKDPVDEDGMFPEILALPRPWGDFSRHTIRRAVEEVNRIADFNVYAHVERGRKNNSVEGITFYAQAKTATDRMTPPTQQEMFKRLNWAKEHQTPMGNLKNATNVPKFANPRSPHYGIEYVLDFETERATGDMLSAAGIGHREQQRIYRSWCDYVAKKSKLKNYDPGPHFRRYVQMRCNVAIANQRAVEKNEEDLEKYHVDLMMGRAIERPVGENDGWIGRIRDYHSEFEIHDPSEPANHFARTMIDAEKMLALEHHADPAPLRDPDPRLTAADLAKMERERRDEAHVVLRKRYEDHKHRYGSAPWSARADVLRALSDKIEEIREPNILAEILAGRAGPGVAELRQPRTEADELAAQCPGDNEEDEK